MSWFSQYKHVGRVAAVILLLVAILGPWTYSSDGTPPAKWCRDPNVLLENGRCVRLVSGAEILAFMTGAFFSMNVGLVTGATVLAGRTREFLGVFSFMMLLFLLMLPIFSTLYVSLGRYSHSRRVFHATASGLAAVFSGLLLVASLRSETHLVLWGMWLYVASAAGALVMELLTKDKRTEGIDANAATNE